MLKPVVAKEQEEQLAALLLGRILSAEPANANVAHSVARAEARRLFCLAMLIVEHLHDARSMLGRGLLGSADAEMLAAVLNLKDPFGSTISSELLARRDVFARLPSWPPRSKEREPM